MTSRTAVLILAVAATISFGSARASSSASDDPYAPLKLYDGKWDVTTTIGGRGLVHLENHCTRTGLFFVCEQMVNGNSQALVIFLPVAKLAGGGEEYRNMGLPADASSSGGWGKVTIDGDKWTYLWESGEVEKKVQWRNINQFSGTDKIHFEIQSSEDGTTWKTVKAGDEVRVTNSIPK
jgi:hypothetical protein